MKLTENIECVPIGSMWIKNETKQKKDIGKISGLYKIINKLNNKYYIGSSNNIKKRWKDHFDSLNNNQHYNIYLQRAWNKYKNENFTFVIFKKIKNLHLLKFEEQKILNSLNKDESYNISKFSTSPMRGRKHTDSAKIKIGISQYGKKLSEITKNKIRKSKIGVKRKPFSKIQRAKMSINVSGIKNPFYKAEKISFKNINTNEIFTGTRLEFKLKHNLLSEDIYRLIYKKRKRVKFWELLNSSRII